MCINWLSVNTVSMNWSCFHYTVVCAPVSTNDLIFLGSNILKREKNSILLTFAMVHILKSQISVFSRRKGVVELYPHQQDSKKKHNQWGCETQLGPKIHTNILAVELSYDFLSGLVLRDIAIHLLKYKEPKHTWSILTTSS